MSRRLTDLYRVGKVLTFDDGSGEPVSVYLRKLSPLDHEKAVRRANAARATHLAIKRKPDDEEFQARLNDMSYLDREEKIKLLISDDLLKVRQLREAEIEHEEDGEWSKEDYLQSLKDAWTDGLRDRYAVDPQDEEALKVFQEMTRYTEQVDKIMEGEERALMKEYEDVPDDVIDQRAVVKLLENESDAVWLREYRQAEVWLAVRDAVDQRQPYFESREEVDELPLKVLTTLIQEYMALSVDPTEGKDLPPADTSSGSSDSSELAATSEPSGPLAVAR